MVSFLQGLFSADNLAPHGICLLWRPELIWLHVVSDALIALAYISIPAALAVFALRRPDAMFGWVFWAFAGFLAACGVTHLLAVWTVWNPDHAAAGVVKAVTAIASVGTAIALWPLLPRALKLPSSAQLREANEALRREVEQRDTLLQAFESERKEHQKTEEMLRQAQKMEAIGQLTAGIAHDFNNLMTVVIGNLDRARRLIPAEGSRQLARALRGAMLGAERAGVLTHRLLAFGRRQPLAPAIMNANDVLEHVADTLRRTLGENIRVVTNFTFELWQTRVDPDALENAVLNLAVNSRDAMPQGGNLVITTRNLPLTGCDSESGLLPGDYIEISVCDTGTGMSPDVASHAFEPFFTTKPVGEGSGLGLSQAYGFALQSQGSAVLESNLGAGTTIRLLLPRALPTATPQQVARAAARNVLAQAMAHT